MRKDKEEARKDILKGKQPYVVRLNQPNFRSHEPVILDANCYFMKNGQKYHFSNVVPEEGTAEAETVRQQFHDRVEDEMKLSIALYTKQPFRFAWQWRKQGADILHVIFETVPDFDVGEVVNIFEAANDTYLEGDAEVY